MKTRRISILFGVAVSSLFGVLAHAQFEHRVLRRVSVFPVQVDASNLSAAADEAWWQIRERLTEGQRFLVASRSFLQQKDVLQPRAELDAADAILLGKLLDAQALVTTFVRDRRISMRVYDGEYGRLLWLQDLDLHPSIPMKEQIPKAAKRLMGDFVAAVPYQAFVTLDPLRGRALYQDNGGYFVRAQIGLDAGIQVGDKAQIIRVFSESLRPLFSGEAPIEVIAEGEITQIERDFVVIRLDRAIPKVVIAEGALVRLPKEMQRLRDAFAISERMRVDTSFVSPEMTRLKEEVAEKKPLVTALTFIANLAVFLLLAL